MLKLKYLTAATLLAIAGNVNADLAQMNSGNGELHFNLWDPVAQVSFTYDLIPNAAVPALGDFSVGSFRPGDLDNVEGHPTGVTAGELVPGAIGVTADGRSVLEQNNVALSWTLSSSISNPTNEWDQFLTSGFNPADVRWDVKAGDATGTSTTKHARSFLTTVSPGTSLSGQIASGEFSNLGNIDVLAQQINVDDLSNPVVDPSDFFRNTPSVDGAYFGDTHGPGWAGAIPSGSLGGLGDSLDFYYITGRSITAITEQFENGAKWSFDIVDGVGTLTYTTNAGGPVVPVPAAVWLLGSGLLGLAGVARRRSAT